MDKTTDDKTIKVKDILKNLNININLDCEIVQNMTIGRNNKNKLLLQFLNTNEQIT